MGSQEPSERIAPEYAASDGMDAVKLLRVGKATSWMIGSAAHRPANGQPPQQAAACPGRTANRFWYRGARKPVC